ncbi:MAG: GtrA family protein [Caulobacterales bacterium]
MKTLKDQYWEPIDQRIRFVLVGVLNTAFSYGFYAAGLWFGLRYSVAALVALVVGIAFGYLTQGRLVFKMFSWSNFPKYTAFWIAMWLLNVGLISAILSIVRNNAYLAGLLSSLVLIVPSYLMQRHWVFSRNTSDHATKLGT